MSVLCKLIMRIWIDEVEKYFFVTFLQITIGINIGYHYEVFLSSEALSNIISTSYDVMQFIVTLCWH